MWMQCTDECFLRSMLIEFEIVAQGSSSRVRSALCLDSTHSRRQASSEQSWGSLHRSCLDARSYDLLGCLCLLTTGHCEDHLVKGE